MYTQSEIDGIGFTSQRSRNRLADNLADKGIFNQKVLDVIKKTPRHLFMNSGLSQQAYEDLAVPISCGQTISQPFIVAKMTEQLLHTKNLNKVLEIGTGSGYQAAILSALIPEVITIERIKTLHQKAVDNFYALQIKNITAILSDGDENIEKHAPFDGIMITAAINKIPQHFTDLLPDGGTIIAPIGETNKPQHLTLFTKYNDTLSEQILLRVQFVPFLQGIA
ncbi:MAG: protein-L-isoaspartate(D-aspartate) O-methyltransferase [Gammaproteobacteria bacterium]|nr:MAG: protein-L-isoaspartate(D-aspartate) O-methyltransferase [Gammaproteobacteria bacterium]